MVGYNGYTIIAVPHMRNSLSSVPRLLNNVYFWDFCTTALGLRWTTLDDIGQGVTNKHNYS